MDPKDELELVRQAAEDAAAELARLVAELEDHYEELATANADHDESWHHFASSGSRPCPCGSGLKSWWESDARGIPLARVCDQCRSKTLAKYRPEVLTNRNYPNDEDGSWHYALFDRAKVRFHLARGENFRKWQVSRGGEAAYFDPDASILKMHGCRLKNHRKTAERIFSGENKTVCAWINCDRVEVIDVTDGGAVPEGWVRFGYDPRVTPHWSANGENCDGLAVDEIVSDGRALYADPAKLRRAS